MLIYAHGTRLQGSWLISKMYCFHDPRVSTFYSICCFCCQDLPFHSERFCFYKMQFVSRYIDGEESNIPLPCLQMICLSNPSQNKTSSKFPKKQLKHVCPNLLSGHFSNPKNIIFFPKNFKALMPERSLLLKAIEEMDDETLKPEKARPLISESEKKTAGDFLVFQGGIKIVVTIYNYRKSEGSFTRCLGGFVVDITKRLGEMMNMFQMGWRNEARVFSLVGDQMEWGQMYIWVRFKCSTCHQEVCIISTTCSHFAAATTWLESTILHIWPILHCFPLI